ncbi:MAG: DMT family transporter [Rhodospirillales bacterium]|nr:DMT family transporter [Rhodospirillales bacterium]
MTNPAEPRVVRNARGILLMIISVAFLAAVDTLVKIALADGMHPFAVAFYRNFFGMIAISPFIFRGGLSGFKTKRLPMHLARGLLHAASMLCWFTALTHIDLAEATALSFTTPIYASIAAIFFMGEPSRVIRWTAAGIGFAGMLILIRPGFAEVNIGVFLVIGSAALIALAKLMVKSLSKTDTPVTIVAFMSLTLTTFTFFPALPYWSWPSPKMLLVFALMGAVGATAHTVQTYSYRDGDITAVEPAGYMRLVWAAAMGFVFFGEVPGIWVWAGAFVIICGSVLLLRDEVMTARAARRSRA